MDKKNIFVVGGSSGIGLEIVRKLTGNQHGIFVGSRSKASLTTFPEVQHLQLDVTEDLSGLEGLPDIVHGLVYCPGTIVQKPLNYQMQSPILEVLKCCQIIAVWVLVERR